MKCLCLVLVVLLTSCTINRSVKFENSYRSPEKFAKEVASYEAKDKKSPSPKGAVVITGSSSVRMWQNRIHKDLKELTIVPRGFGGSNMNDLLHYSDQLILKHKPRAVVIYEGDNDTAQDIAPLQVIGKLKSLKHKLLASNRNIRIYLISVKPSYKRIAMWEQMTELNEMMEEFCDDNENFYYIDTASVLMDGDKPRTDIFIKDQLPLNSKGYDLWSAAVRKVLVPVELKYEK